MAEKEPSGDHSAKQKGLPSCTPDVWMLKWLYLRRQILEDSLQNVAPAILDHLVQEGHIDPLRSAVYQEIMSDATVPLQKARKLLDWLSSQPPTVFWTFLQAICQSGLPEEAVRQLVVSDKEVRELTELAKHMPLSEKLSLVSGPAVVKVREKLQRFFRSCDTLPMSAGFAKGKAMPMDDIWVNICLLSMEEVTRAFKNTSRCTGSTFVSSEQDRERADYVFSKILANEISPPTLDLGEVFKANEGAEDANDSEKCVLASGGAGCGKTTCFTRKAPYEWAHGRLWQQFVLLFCLELRDKSVWKAKTLAELLRLNFLGLNAQEQEDVVLFITKHPAHVVIICDGLDEGYEDQQSFLWSLLHGKCVGVPTKLRVVVTSRPCMAACWMSESGRYQGVEVVGFTREDVATFAHRYFGEEMVEMLLTQLDKLPFLTGLMHAPLFCLLICDLFKVGQELPSRRTDIFEKIVTAILQRYAKAHSIKVPFKYVAHAPANLRALIMSLGKLAFNGLQEEQMYFTDVEMEEAGVSTEALQFGLLIRCESTEFWKRDEYSFSHLTMQEFLAALYASGELLKTDDDIVTLLE